ncbi:hypothetical protein [Amorphus sp. 3PC139-8]
MLSYLVLARSALRGGQVGSDANAPDQVRADHRRWQLIHRLYGMIG